MTEILTNTISTYLGPEFQQRLIWQLLVEPEFAEKTIEDLSIEYFDDPNIKRLFIIMLEYYNEYGKVPNLQNQSIQQAINKYKTPHNVIEEETLFSVIKRIVDWNERVMNKEMLYEGDVVQKATTDFIKQQEYRKLGEFILSKTKNGDIKHKYIIGEIENKIQKISIIGDEEDYGTEVIDGIDRALRKEFRETIPTGIHVIDMLTGGGLGKGEIGIVLSPSGVGKTTILTKIANTSYEQDKNVIQIIFEDTEDQIKRKHYTIWSKTALSDIDDNREYVAKTAYDKAASMKGKGHLVIKQFSQEDTTMIDIKNWIVNYQKKWGYKFDIVILDYLDLVDPHKRVNNVNEGELVVVKSFEAMASDFNIPCWTAIQSNRCLDLNTIVDIKNRGRVKIGTVKINEKILTENGYRKITNVFPITKQKTFKIKTKSGKEIICSEKHQFPINDNKIKSISTGLRVGDKLKINNGLNKISLIDDEIVSIEEYDEINTIDITVDETHMFFGNDIYTHNSGFDAEFVEAHQSGGNIKRIQKAHFFMSVAKTPSQKESNLANIRIIKARFAADGQTFIDAYFNNNTMEIRIEDDRYPVKHTLKKHDDGDVDKVINQAEGLRLKENVLPSNIPLHSEICKHSEENLIDVVNYEGINEGIKSVPDDLLTLDNTNVSDAVNDDLLDWTGETINVVEKVSEVNDDYKVQLPIGVKIEPNTISINDIEKTFIDPDEEQGGSAKIRNMLDKLREKQNN